MMKKSKKLLSALVSGLMMLQLAAVVPASAETADSNPNLIVNGDFEEGYTDWKQAQYNVLQTVHNQGNPYDGDNFAQLYGNKGNYMYQEITVEKNTSYALSFVYRTAEENPAKLRILVAGEAGLDKTWGQGYPEDGKSLIGTSVNLTTDPDKKYTTGKVYAETTEWTKINEAFDTGNNSKIYVVAMSDGPDGAKGAYLDSIELKKQTELLNGGFEAGELSGWLRYQHNALKSIHNLGDPYEGESFAQLWGADSFTFQKINVEKNTPYVLSFAYRNPTASADKLRILVAGEAGLDKTWGLGYPEDGKSLIGTSVDLTTNPDGKYKTGKTYNATTEWTTVSENFNTGDNSVIYIVAMHDKTNDPTTNGPFLDAFSLEKQTTLLNGDFEEGQTGWSTIVYNIEGSGANTGDKCAQFWGVGSYIWQSINVEKNTDYQISFAYKQANLDKSNPVRLTITGENGLNDGYPVDGTSLIGDNEAKNEEGAVTQKPGKLYPINDEWTTVTEVFNTGDNGVIYIVAKNEWGSNAKDIIAPYVDSFTFGKYVKPEITVTNATAAKTDNTLTVSAKLYNSKINDTLTTAAIAAVYDSNGKLVKAALENVDLEYLHQTDFNTSITFDEGTDTTGYTAAIYLWNRTTNMPYLAKTPVTLN